MPHADRIAGKPNIVLLSGSADWMHDVCDQALELGLGPIHTASTPQEAMTLLAGGFPPVSHLLLQPTSAGDLLPELVDMTAGQSAGIALVVLGEPAPLPDHPSAGAMTFVPTPTQGWLERVLTDGVADRKRGVTDRPSLQELKDALADSRIQTRYQPIVRLDNGQPIGLEVLARMEHPTRGILQPDLFVPRIEEAGLAWPLTQAVILRAFADWAGGRLGSFGLTMALNFPLDVLLIPEAVTWLEAQRVAAGLPADRLMIELTESRPVSQLERLSHAVATLRSIGYGLAIDDVGPGLRDHQALLDLRFTALKLDKDLVRDSGSDPAAHDFLVATVAAARAAKLAIIAEGVEDAAIWQRMQALGVDQAQGFLVARPLPAAAVPLWHQDWCSRLTQEASASS